MVALVAACGVAACEAKPRRIPDAEHAAKLAADVANREAMRKFGLSPFTPKQYQASWRGERWHWGHLIPAGHMAIVSFDGFGNDIQVEVHFSPK